LEESRRLRAGARPLLVSVERTGLLQAWPDPIAVLRFSMRERPQRLSFVNSYGNQFSPSLDRDDGAIQVPLRCGGDVCTGELEVHGDVNVTHDLTWEVEGEVYHPGLGDAPPLEFRLTGGGD
jgi:hypothetical protein